MLKDAVARRYSAALFALAHESGAMQETLADLDAFVGALAQDPGAAEFYASPVIAKDAKIDVIADGLRGRTSDLVLNFLVLLVRKRRENIVGLVARQMHELADDAAGRAIVDIESPKPLPPDELAELARRLSSVYKRTLVPKQKIQPEMLGGIVIQVGDKYVDASVAGKLEELRRQLMAAGEEMR